MNFILLPFALYVFSNIKVFLSRYTFDIQFGMVTYYMNTSSEYLKFIYLLVDDQLILRHSVHAYLYLRI